MNGGGRSVGTFPTARAAVIVIMSQYIMYKHARTGTHVGRYIAPRCDDVYLSEEQLISSCGRYEKSGLSTISP